MKIYMKQSKVLLLFTILTSIIASLGYVFMAVLLQKLLDIAVEKNMQQFIPMVLFSIFYFSSFFIRCLLCYYFFNPCLAKGLLAKSLSKFELMYLKG